MIKFHCVHCIWWDDSSSCPLQTSAQPAQCRRLLHLSLFRDKGGVWLFQFVLVWPLSWRCHTGINSFPTGNNPLPLAALLKEQTRYPHLYTQLEAFRGCAVFIQEAYSKHSNWNLTSQPSSLRKLCLPNAVTGSLQRLLFRCYPGFWIDLLHIKTQPWDADCCQQPFLGSQQYLPFLMTSWTNPLSYISNLPAPTLFPWISLSLQTSQHPPLAHDKEGITWTPDSAKRAPHEHHACCVLWRQPGIHSRKS